MFPVSPIVPGPRGCPLFRLQRLQVEVKVELFEQRLGEVGLQGQRLVGAGWGGERSGFEISRNSMSAPLASSLR